MMETLANGYSSESTQQELFNEYQHGRVKMVFKKFRILVLLMKVVSALEGLSQAPCLQCAGGLSTSTVVPPMIAAAVV